MIHTTSVLTFEQLYGPPCLMAVPRFGPVQNILEPVKGQNLTPIDVQLIFEKSSLKNQVGQT